MAKTLVSEHRNLKAIANPDHYLWGASDMKKEDMAQSQYPPALQSTEHIDMIVRWGLVYVINENQIAGFPLPNEHPIKPWVVDHNIEGVSDYLLSFNDKFVIVERQVNPDLMDYYKIDPWDGHIGSHVTVRRT